MCIFHGHWKMHHPFNANPYIQNKKGPTFHRNSRTKNTENVTMMKDMTKDMSVSVISVSVENPNKVDVSPTGHFGLLNILRALHSWQAVSIIACCNALMVAEWVEADGLILGKRMRADENARAEVEEVAATVTPRTRLSHSHGIDLNWCHMYLNAAMCMSPILRDANLVNYVNNQTKTASMKFSQLHPSPAKQRCQRSQKYHEILFVTNTRTSFDKWFSNLKNMDVNHMSVYVYALTPLIQ